MITTYRAVEAGQYWSAIDCEFKVTEVKHTEEGVWIFYENTNTGQSYSCLEAAFRYRFSLIENRG